MFQEVTIKKIRVMIVDDHALMRDGLRLNLELRGGCIVVGEAADGREALAKAMQLRPEVVVMDVAMPKLNGLEAARLITGSLPGVRILILSMYGSGEHTNLASRAGVQGYLLKESAGNEVVEAVRALAQGRCYYGRGVVPPEEQERGQRRAQSPLESLSAREREVLQLVVEGHSSAGIALELQLSVKSVNTYRCRLMQKLQLEGTTALTSFALQRGLATSH